jgi:pyrroloquinoline quinone biosynthesis protein E
LDFARHGGELATGDWLRVFREAEELGVVQLHLTGGEPLARKDLEPLVEGARELDLYTNLITSGLPLTRDRLARLKKAGLDAVQLSVQDVDEKSSDRIAGLPCFQEKMAVAAWVAELGLPLTINVVLHRDNLDHVEAIIDLAQRLGAHRVELANTQYLGWAHANRDALMPTRAQLDRGREIAARARARLEGEMEVLYVLPDYYADRPRACMDGWGRRFVNVTPNGTVLPCHAAQSILGLNFERVTDRSLRDIWESSPAICAFRGEDWMVEPCRSCPSRTVDFGGCRCQAFLLTGNAAVADPACSLSIHHGLVENARAQEGANVVPARFLYRGGRS